MSPEAPAVTIEPPEDGEEAMPRLLHALMQTAVTRRPRLARRVRGSLALRSTDVPASATVRFERGRIVVTGGVAEGAWIAIEADAQTLAELAGGDLAAVRSRRARLRGLPRHPLFALRVQRLLAVAARRA